MTVRPRALRHCFASAVVCGGVAVSACSLVTSLEGYAGPEAVDGSSDAPPRDDGGRDAPASDAADASVDAPPVPFCLTLSSQPTFCDDFERSELLGAWTREIKGNGGAIVVEPSTSAAGRELHATLPHLKDAGIGKARLDKVFGQTNEATLAFRLRVDAAPTDGALQVMTLTINPPASSDFLVVFLMIRPSGVGLAHQTFPNGATAGGTYREEPLEAAFPFGAQQSVELHVELAAPPRMTLKLGGKVAFDGSLATLFRPGVVTVAAGLNYTEAPAGPLSIRIDDVVVDVK
jgi:hypothetical protein